MNPRNRLGVRRALRSAGLALLVLLVASSAQAISLGGLGPFGEGGTVNGYPIAIGGGGTVYELDAFVGIGGGGATRLPDATLPVGLDFTFNSQLLDGDTDLVLSYGFANNTGADLHDVTVLSFLDAEIDWLVNSNFNELAAISGALVSGQNFEVDEPGFVFGDIYANLLAGSLDGTNALEVDPDDVSMALSFDVATLHAGETLETQILISEDGDRLGTFAITQFDTSPVTDTVITYSGRSTLTGGPPASVIPEPGGALVFGVGLAVVGARLRGQRRRGSMGRPTGGRE